VEVCNGADDDCDLVADEDFPCAEGEETPCTTSCGTVGTGMCGTGCVLPEGDLCEPPVEICNDFVDNDCDLDVDCTDIDCLGDLACG
jgi:hypothetical protein